jgi:TonB family protein
LSKNSKSNLKGNLQMKKVLFSALILTFVLSLSAQNEPANITTPISGGVVNGKATSLPKPQYPAAAKAVRASGAVNVEVLIDEEGNVVSASAITGHPLLRAASQQAARSAKFSPTRLSGQLVKVRGIIVYNFVAAGDWIGLGRALAIKDFEGLKSRDFFPSNFVTEKKQLDAIIAENQPDKLDNFTETLQAKLYQDKTGDWELSVGLALGRIKANIDDQNEIRTQLLKIKELSDFPVENTSETRLVKLKELADFIAKSKFSNADKLKITDICNSIY